MNRQAVIILGCAALLLFGSASYGDNEARPFIGLRLDPDPLPEWVAKHLGLEPGQGIKIDNVCVGSSADEVGLERDDILVAFAGEKITDLDRFVDAVQKAGIGTKVSLEAIHLGQRKTLQFELEPIGEVEWKYVSEPDVVTALRPGRIFRMGPSGKEWIEIPVDKLPDFDIDVERFFRETYTYSYDTDGEQYTITIRGDPTDEDTQVQVRVGDTEHDTTVGDVDALPERYRASAREAIENAKKNSKNVQIRSRFRLPEPPRPDVYRKFFEQIPEPDMDRFLERVPRPDWDRWSEQKDAALEKLQKQMERLQERMKQLEEHHREMLDKLLDKNEAPPEGEATQPPTPSQGDAEDGV